MLKWKVDEPPTGRYRSFDRRGWPTAYYSDGTVAAQIHCDDEYIPRHVKAGTHAPLKVWIADHGRTPWKWMRIKAEFATLELAKAGAVRVLAGLPAMRGGR